MGTDWEIQVQASKSLSPWSHGTRLIPQQHMVTTCKMPSPREAHSTLGALLGAATCTPSARCTLQFQAPRRTAGGQLSFGQFRHSEHCSQRSTVGILGSQFPDPSRGRALPAGLAKDTLLC